jgi:hypothetical protein
VVAELLAHVLVEAEVLEEVVALEDGVFLHHPQALLRDERLQDRRRDVRMVVAAERVADIVQERAHHVLLVAPITVRARRGLQRVLESAHRIAAVVLTQHAQVREHAIG